jgi:hypothetical protein
MPSALPPAKILEFLVKMPDWFRAVLLGGALVISALFLFAPTSQSADIASLDERVNANARRITHLEDTLDRIEIKIDQLILHLIPVVK